MEVADVLKKLESLGSRKNVEDMERFGITTKRSFGVPTPVLKQFAREVKKQADDRHQLAEELWQTGIYDARVVAFMIDDPKRVTENQMNAWSKDFDNWGTVDGTCCYLFCHTSFAYKKAAEWSESKHEFVKRAGFALMAYLAVHDKKAGNEAFAQFLTIIEKQSNDDRNFVKKAVNWALRQIGKRNLGLNKLAIGSAERIKIRDSKAARWIASDALRELKSEKVAVRFRKRRAMLKTDLQ
jgi:3-methyladenine DNA glycosylase AlkD